MQKEDIPVLLSIGKEHLYVWEKDDTKYHENEGAEILFSICQNPMFDRTEVKEGKIELIANTDGVFVLDKVLLDQINSIGEMIIAARRNYYPVKKGDKVAGMRVIPLVIDKQKLDQAQKIAHGKALFRIFPYQHKKIGIVTTGSEVAQGRIKDAFGPVIEKKLQPFGAEILGQTIVTDSHELITEAIQSYLVQGADMVICTGGMSVDPDDRTPLAIKNAGTEIISYGAPVLPGAMFLLSYYKKRIPVIGLPGCVMYAGRTIFDLVLPRLMADITITAQDLAKMGDGGLCLSCDECTFPNCSFGQ